MNLESEVNKLRERMQAMAKEMGEMRVQNRVLMLS